MARPITVVVADEQPTGRDGVRRSLVGHDGVELVAEAACLEVVLALLREHDPLVVVVDLDMPASARSRDEVLAELVAHAPTLRIVVVTTLDDPQQACSDLAGGAHAYVLKHGGADGELVDAIRSVVAGDPYLDPLVGGRLASAAPRRAARPEELTVREVEVLRLLAVGHTNAEISERLVVSVRTVESHRAHIQRKLNRTSRAELVRYAVDHGVLDDRPEEDPGA